MADYKTKMIEEYNQLKERYNKLHRTIVKHDANMLDFPLRYDIDLMKKLASIMGQYLYILEIMAEIEQIDLRGGNK